MPKLDFNDSHHLARMEKARAVADSSLEPRRGQFRYQCQHPSLGFKVSGGRVGAIVKL